MSGLWAALPTPLTPSASIDHAVFTTHAVRLLQAGCDGIVVFGTTGEGPSFSAIERLAAVESLLKSGVGPHQIGLGAGFPMLPDTAALVRSAMALGLYHMLLLPPYFYRDVEADGIEEAFRITIDRVGNDRLRLTLYHIPQVAGVGVPPEVAARLRNRYGVMVAGVKDSSGDLDQFRAFRATAPDLAVSVGHEADIAAALAEGGAGTICGMANVCMPLVQAMFRNASAAKTMRKAIGLIGGPFIPALKAVLAAQTTEPAWLRVRPPLRPGDVSRGGRIAAALTALQAAAVAIDQADFGVLSALSTLVPPAVGLC